MSSILIHGGSKKARKDKALTTASERGVDPKHVEIIYQKKMGIDVIKEMISKAHVRSRGGSEKAVVILEAQRLTKPAQNALLKTLEEPPAHLTLILTAPSPKLLLPTVVSRCTFAKAEGEREAQKQASDPFIKKLLSAAPGKRIAMLEEEIGYGKEDVLEFFDRVEAHLKLQIADPKIVQSKKVGGAAKKLEKLWRSKKFLREETANVKLVVDEWLLSW